jgi:hypothetical protein
MNYDVGQIIYVVSSESERVVPMQIVEEIRRRTVKGEEVTYLVKSGPDAQGSFKLEELKGQVFGNLELATAFLKKNFESWLEKQIEWTVNAQRTWYVPTQQSPIEGE